MSEYYSLISNAIDESIVLLKSYGDKVDPGHWQGVTTEGHPDLVTKELINLTFQSPIPESDLELSLKVKPNLPWAEDEFQERVGRTPRNPHASLQKWPWWRGQEGKTMYEGMFTHTYSERFWPRLNHDGIPCDHRPRGIRYAYGDLDDVVNLLLREPHTRQATFPIFFPEDTGAVHGGRIPCTLHYHFLLRKNRLHLWYPIRSCDAVRHFRDDVYMAGRLCQWMIEECCVRGATGPMVGDSIWEHTKPGMLHFTAYSFHVHMGDLHLL
jgi:hypothetical protein